MNELETYVNSTHFRDYKCGVVVCISYHSKCGVVYKLS